LGRKLSASPPEENFQSSRACPRGHSRGWLSYIKSLKSFFECFVFLSSIQYRF
jgi:hypothetical protein